MNKNKLVTILFSLKFIYTEFNTIFKGLMWACGLWIGICRCIK